MRGETTPDGRSEALLGGHTVVCDVMWSNIALFQARHPCASWVQTCSSFAFSIVFPAQGNDHVFGRICAILLLKKGWLWSSKRFSSDSCKWSCYFVVWQWFISMVSGNKPRVFSSTLERLLGLSQAVPRATRFLQKQHKPRCGRPGSPKARVGRQGWSLASPSCGTHCTVGYVFPARQKGE